MTIYFNDKGIIKACGDELEHIILVDGVDYGLSYLKSLLSTQYSKSQIFLQGISSLKVVKTLLSRVSEQEADAIRQILRKGEINDNRTTKGGKGGGEGYGTDIRGEG